MFILAFISLCRMVQGSELQCHFAFLFIPPLSPSKRAFPRPSHQRAHHFPEKGEAVSSGSGELESLSGLCRGSWQSHEEPREPLSAEDGSDRRLSQCQGPAWPPYQPCQNTNTAVPAAGCSPSQLTTQRAEMAPMVRLEMGAGASVQHKHTHQLRVSRLH